MQGFLEKLWYGKSRLSWILWPLSQIYCLLVSLRRVFLQSLRQKQFPVPVIVVGNLTTGGTGKTPLVIAIVKALQEKGLKAGVVSRGYGACIKKFPHVVSKTDTAAQVGDEPLLMASKLNAPVVIAPVRADAVQYLLDHHACDIVVSDDGLQHYAMGRAIEIVVIDGVRGLGNGFCLPAGPLRERPDRLKKADFLVVNGGQWPAAWSMTLQAGPLTQLSSGQQLTTYTMQQPVAAVAGIGHPWRFFSMLEKLGIVCRPYIFPDHHRFREADLQLQEKTLIMTEKDAVKCRSFAADCWYFLPVEAQLTDSFWQALWSHERLKGYLK